MTDIGGISSSIPSRLGGVAVLVDDELVLRVVPSPETSRLGSVRASVLAYAIDAVAGITVDSDQDSWTFTSDLSVHMRPVMEAAWVDARAVVLRRGKRSAVCETRLVDDRGRVVAYGTAGFSTVSRRDGDAEKLALSIDDALEFWGRVPPIDRPLREAAGIEVMDANNGVVHVEIADNLRNPSGALQGAMVALIAEAAAEEFLSAQRNAPALVTDLDIRYLAQARVGPVRTRVETLGDWPNAPVRVELLDASSNKLLTHVVARAAP